MYEVEVRIFYVFLYAGVVFGLPVGRRVDVVLQNEVDPSGSGRFWHLLDRDQSLKRVVDLSKVITASDVALRMRLQTRNDRERERRGNETEAHHLFGRSRVHENVPTARAR